MIHIGLPLVIDLLIAQKLYLNYARICVQVDKNSNLPNGILTNLLGEEISLNVQYNWEPRACEHCGSLFHASQTCLSKPASDNLPTCGQSHSRKSKKVLVTSPFPPSHEIKFASFQDPRKQFYSLRGTSIFLLLQFYLFMFANIASWNVHWFHDLIGIITIFLSLKLTSWIFFAFLNVSFPSYNYWIHCSINTSSLCLKAMSIILVSHL